MERKFVYILSKQSGTKLLSVYTVVPIFNRAWMWQCLYRAGQSIMDKNVFLQCLGTHVLLKLILGMKSTGWCVLGC
jgi:hypothetical protein